MRNKRVVKVGNVLIGGDNSIKIQSMTNTDTGDVKSTVEQLKALYSAGAHLVRVTANTEKAARAIEKIKEEIRAPIIADIHYDAKLALLAMESGADKIRINPGNMSKDRLDEIIEWAKKKDIPIRIGVNSGSIEKKYLKMYGRTPEAMLASMKDMVEYFQERDFHSLVLSAKSTDPVFNIKINRLLDKEFDYPLHLGVTEAGTLQRAVLKSAIGIGSLLADEIGDTLRVSITGDPLMEIPAAMDILKALSLMDSLNVISCPTCGRTHGNLEKVVQEVEKALGHRKVNANIAIMGCAVNGPGEAREADAGVAGSKDGFLFFRKGNIIGQGSEEEAIAFLVKEVEKLEK